MEKQPEIYNKYGEKLETLIEGAPLKVSKQIVIFAHGFGTNLHEQGIFDQQAHQLITDNFDITTIRFSYSGYGKSEGKQETKTLQTMADDLSSVFSTVAHLTNAPKSLIAFSLGNHVTARTLKNKTMAIKTIICINIPEFNLLEGIEKQFLTKSTVDNKGTWHIPRSSSTTTLLGQPFLSNLNRETEQINMVKLAQNYQCIRIVAENDEKVLPEDFSEIPFSKEILLAGDHGFTDEKNRNTLVKTISKEINHKWLRNIQ